VSNNLVVYGSYCAICGKPLNKNDWERVKDPNPPIPQLDTITRTKCCHSLSLFPPFPDFGDEPHSKLREGTQRLTFDSFTGAIHFCNYIGKSPTTIYRNREGYYLDVRDKKMLDKVASVIMAKEDKDGKISPQPARAKERR